jgi:F0F1-type ATP synthase assembly protein I
MSKKKEIFDVVSLLSLVTQLGLMMVIPILGCTLLGKYIDDKFNTTPIFLIILLILGVGGAFSGVYKTVIIYTKTKRK